MRYPGAPSTVAASDYSTYIKIELTKPASAKTSKGVGAKTARAASTSATAPLPVNPILNTLEWQRLMTQLGTLQTPKLSRKPSASAIRDKGAAPSQWRVGHKHSTAVGSAGSVAGVAVAGPVRMSQGVGKLGSTVVVA